MFCVSIASSLLFTEFAFALTWGLFQVYRDFCRKLQSYMCVGYEHLIALEELDEAVEYLTMMRNVKDDPAQIEPLVRLMPKLRAGRSSEAMGDVELEPLGKREGSEREVGRNDLHSETQRHGLERDLSGLC